MENNLISVAMATYNGEKYLREQLESIYNQTYKNIEVIVNDDCSTDGTVKILHEFHIKYGLKYQINSQNQGFVLNFQKALVQCSGDFIALADQDDIWLPNKLETLLYEINGYSMICTDAILIDDKGKQLHPSLKLYQNIYIPEKDMLQYLVYNNFATGCTCFLNKDLLDTALPIPIEFGYHDWWLAIVATKARGIRYLANPLVLYRQHSTNDVGAIIYLPIFSKLYRGLKNIFKVNRLKTKYYTMKVKSLSLLLQSSLPLLPNEKAFIKDALELYKDKLNSSIHLKSFSIALKHQSYIFPKHKFIDKQLSAVAWLLN